MAAPPQEDMFELSAARVSSNAGRLSVAAVTLKLREFIDALVVQLQW